MKRVRITSIFIVFCVLISLVFSGCVVTEKSDTVAETEEGEAEAVTDKEQERPLKILFYSSYPNWPMDYRTGFIPTEMRKRTGVDFEIEQTPGGDDYRTKLNLYLSSGQSPDLFYTAGADDLMKWKTQGAIMPLTELLDEHCKDYKKMVDPRAWKYVTFDNEIWGMPSGARPEPGNEPNVVGVVARFDWVKKLGFAEKAMSEDFDLNQYHELIKAMTFNDPDGNGLDDTYGLTEVGIKCFDHILGAYGLPGKDGWIKKGNEVVRSSMTEEFKEAVKLIKKWYEEGVIDPEYITYKNANIKENLINSKWGTTCRNMWWLNPDNPVLKTLLQKTPDAELKIIVPPKGETGARGGAVSSDPGGGRKAVVSSECPYPDKLMKLVNYGCTDEGFDIASYGIEGTHYNLVDGRIQFIEPYNKREEQEKLGNTRIIGMIDRRWAPPVLRQAIAACAKYTIDSEFYGSVPAYAEYPDIAKIVDEAVVKVITGQTSVDELDKMQQRWYENGGDVITEQINEAWKELNNTQ